MDIYAQKSRWKIYLAFAGLIITIISLAYTNYVADQLVQEEKKRAELWAKAMISIKDSANPNSDVSFLLEYIQSNTIIPVILTSDTDMILDHQNFGEGKDGNYEFLKAELQRMKNDGIKPIEINGQLLYHRHSKLLTQLQYFPFIQMGLIAFFIAISYSLFSTARRDEQNQVWVGMSKETAHQLGTPISAIIAWIEHLRMAHEGDEATQEILGELDNDVNRLNLVADRFSKIGSAPALQRINIYEQLEGCRNYMQRRAPRKVTFGFPGTNHAPLYVNINVHLFDWVIENLMRNAIDAMENGEGIIAADVYEEKDFICINITDTGKGIPHNKFKTVFQPGYTTKKRGWGLGLSLAKRIVESYHSGKIFVKKSVPNDETTFTIKLPK